MSRRPCGSAAVSLLTLGLVALWDPSAGRAADPPPPADTAPTSEVTVTTKYDERTLEHVLVPRFVETHAVPTAAIEQITRWYGRICPGVAGLRPDVSELVVRRIETTAQSVGVQSATPGQKCDVHIQVLFTSNPQALLDDIDNHHPYLLGSARQRGDTRITRPVQVWYTTGTRQKIPPDAPMPGFLATHDATQGSARTAELAAGTTPQEFSAGAGSPGLTPDPPYSGPAPTGLAGSYVTVALRSELLHVLVIVDARKLESAPLQPLADYIAMISLTRITSLDACNELPSILDLLSERCAGRPRPAGLTPADTAYLKALYSTELDKKLNVEQGEVRDRMAAILLNKP